MFSSMRDLIRGRCRVSPPGAWTFLTVGVMVFVGAMVSLATPVAGPMGSSSDESVRAGYVPQVVDLRCLTRRPADCLDEPVSPDEPHGAVCATCHDLWSNRDDPRDVRSCTDADCHGDPGDLSPFHTTLVPEMLADCSHCHVAHEFRADAEACSACHSGAGDRVAWAGGRLLDDLPFPEVLFVHGDHAQVPCDACHGVGYTHATLKVKSRDDCRSCHHGAQLQSTCRDCHGLEAVNALEIHVSRALAIDIGSVVRPVRWLPFPHRTHVGTACVTCHTEGAALATGVGADCSTCHAQHHEPTADCSACHARPAAGAHDARAHLGCEGAGCHEAPAGIRDAPRTRTLCLVCHRDRGEHQVGRQCSECHILPGSTYPGGATDP
ncbi:MAG TPA: hypothetical protein VLA36_09155 [Longimicrobiales bacterium]|nr:hypothetical protein [Longimicrobiales bacterium]